MQKLSRLKAHHALLKEKFIRKSKIISKATSSLEKVKTLLALHEQVFNLLFFVKIYENTATQEDEQYDYIAVEIKTEIKVFFATGNLNAEIKKNEVSNRCNLYEK